MKNKLLLAALSGILLTLSFPKASISILAWLALMPLLLAFELCKTRQQTLLCGFVAGLTFYFTSLYWFIHVAWIAVLFMPLLETFFFCLLAWLCFEIKKIHHPILKVLWFACSWTVVEIIRTEIPVFGFGWNLLAYSQAGVPWALQSSNLFGAYGLGFCLALFNAAFFYSVYFCFFLKKKFKSVIALFFFMVLLVGGLFFYGNQELKRAYGNERSIRVSVLQGNIPQHLKWDPDAREKIIEIYEKLSRLAYLSYPDLIIWPEASFPGYFNKDWQAENVSGFVSELGKQTVIGAPHYVDTNTVYNSAYLLGSDGKVQERYDKIYLVPFGEYVPLKFIFGWLQKFAESLGVSDFSPGTEYKVLSTEAGVPFSVMICFEDVRPHLARNFVNLGASFLTLITNDAWFMKTSAPYQHLQASIFRAVENGVAIVRSANTGVSSFISKKGEVFARVRNKQGQDLFVTGHETQEVSVKPTLTFYRRIGFRFPYFLLVIFITTFIMRRIWYQLRGVA